MANDPVHKMFNYIILLNGHLISLINSKILVNTCRYSINIDEIKVAKLTKCYTQSLNQTTDKHTLS